MKKATIKLGEYFYVDFTITEDGEKKWTTACLYNRAGILLLSDRCNFCFEEEGYDLEEIAAGFLKYYHDTAI